MADKDDATGLVCLGLLTLVGSAAIALEQIVTYGGWEPEETLSPLHHEGVAILGLILGVSFIGIAGLKGA